MKKIRVIALVAALALLTGCLGKAAAIRQDLAEQTILQLQTNASDIERLAAAIVEAQAESQFNAALEQRNLAIAEGADPETAQTVYEADLDTIKEDLEGLSLEINSLAENDLVAAAAIRAMIDMEKAEREAGGEIALSLTGPSAKKVLTKVYEKFRNVKVGETAVTEEPIDTAGEVE